MSTADNLQEAFAGESQANRRYLAFAKKAEADGYKQVARLFRAVAQAETVHALADLRLMGAVQDTAANLKTAVAGEAHEFKTMYPAMIETAEAEKNKAAAINFRFAQAVEETHHGYYEDALAAVEKGADLPEQSIFVCEVCGHTALGSAPGRCPVCGAPQSKFLEVV